VNQLEDASDYGHYLWVFFPKSQWTALPIGEREQKEKKLRTKGFGLLLVEGHVVTEELVAKRHNPTPDKIDEVLRCMGKLSIERDRLPVVDAIDASQRLQASRAAAAAAIAAPFVAAALEKAGLGKVAFKTMDWELGDEDLENWVDHLFLLHDADLNEGINIQTDPFGQYLQDGRPALWIWSATSKENLEKYISQPVRTFGTH
jgi:hypothetical protein